MIFARTKVRRHQTSDEGHGREEHRYHYLCPAPDDLADRARWSNLRAIGIVISHTWRNGKECFAVRYYIPSKYIAAHRLAGAVRGIGHAHFGIAHVVFTNCVATVA